MKKYIIGIGIFILIIGGVILYLDLINITTIFIKNDIEYCDIWLDISLSHLNKGLFLKLIFSIFEILITIIAILGTYYLTDKSNKEIFQKERDESREQYYQNILSSLVVYPFLKSVIKDTINNVSYWRMVEVSFNDIPYLEVIKEQGIINNYFEYKKSKVVFEDNIIKIFPINKNTISEGHCYCEDKKRKYVYFINIELLKNIRIDYKELVYFDEDLEYKGINKNKIIDRLNLINDIYIKEDTLILSRGLPDNEIIKKVNIYLEILIEDYKKFKEDVKLLDLNNMDIDVYDRIEIYINEKLNALRSVLEEEPYITKEIKRDVELMVFEFKNENMYSIYEVDFLMLINKLEFEKVSEELKKLNLMKS